MSAYAEWPLGMSLKNERISDFDASRQEVAARELLRRLVEQPGVILADEVGMGKTFVALAVATAVMTEHPQAGPVVIMTPPNLREKWPNDWEVFRTKCLTPEVGHTLRSASAETGVEFLRLLDDPPDSRKSLIFLTHGAMKRSIGDGLIKLAIIKRALHGRRSVDEERRSLAKFGGQLLQLGVYEAEAPGLIEDLLRSPYSAWKDIMPDKYWQNRTKDDPIPAHLISALDEMSASDLQEVVDQLRQLPRRASENLKSRLKEVRAGLAEQLEVVWTNALTRAAFHSPLLVLDEAHHAKNPATQLASLFVNDEGTADAESVAAAGALGGKFDRMLFLTATPFQLGHQELVRVLDRFDGIRWGGTRKPGMSRAVFAQARKDLLDRLNEAQAAAIRLDASWSRLTEADVREFDPEGTGDAWWENAVATPGEGRVASVVDQVERTRERMHAAEQVLAPWVLRHVKPAILPGHLAAPRRSVLPGAAIKDGGSEHSGLEIPESVLLPFLLAGRAQSLFAQSKRGQALFAEGLASSFEAYQDTRSPSSQLGTRDNDAEAVEGGETSPELEWYLRQLDRALPRSSVERRAAHPKVEATAHRAVELWKIGEKVLIFCHYRATGRALRQHISQLLQRQILGLATAKLPGVKESEVEDRLEALGERFFDEGPLQRAVTNWIGALVDEYPFTEEEKRITTGVIRRFVRTPSYLARFLPLDVDALTAVFSGEDESQTTAALARSVRLFCRFLAERCTADERMRYVKALDAVQTGSHRGREVANSSDRAEGVDSPETRLLPNVRLANGEVRAETRQRLLLTFNTPLFPEILIASSVMAEGVDLHLSCRHVIHHDLCWNPSTLEQRTGRVDRIGCRAEQVEKSILLYLPYVAATQDEKMFRVVRDRERWFQIVMGEKFASDEASTEREAAKIPLPRIVQEELSLRLH